MQLTGKLVAILFLAFCSEFLKRSLFRFFFQGSQIYYSLGRRNLLFYVFIILCSYSIAVYNSLMKRLLITSSLMVTACLSPAETFPVLTQ